jgi:hypothetical protein
MAEGEGCKVSDRKEESQIFVGKQESGGGGKLCIMNCNLTPVRCR